MRPEIIIDAEVVESDAEQTTLGGEQACSGVNNSGAGATTRLPKLILDYNALLYVITQEVTAQARAELAANQLRASGHKEAAQLVWENLRKFTAAIEAHLGQLNTLCSRESTGN